ncbi:MAG TPA: S1 RNA-binding domain-containing protein, partial [Geobacteraceae bacterium]
MNDDIRNQRSNNAPIKRFKDSDEESDHGAQGEFAEMFHDSLKQLKVGEVVKGVVVQVTQDFVLVDVGYKSEGCIPISEFIDESGQPKVSVG